ncbi:MAG: ORF6N domain-containing protein [Fibrobacter sp.]|uniref:ORF6N domain-containing protein n=1 Tax=Fibrobacter sp. TaxID=35828 RepID=UPI002A909D0E|nr:ORF6N domain-containing protein [Fibrobacter sp.]MDY6264444.1 ORF6N domain-containing protein [Fibrobacter sp.]
MKDIERVAMTPLDESGVGKMIRVIRNKQVLLDSDLAILYGVETKRINEQVKRNIERFPEKFCFQLNSDEVESVKSQIATSRGAGFFAGQNGGASQESLRIHGTRCRYAFRNFA